MTKKKVSMTIDTDIFKEFQKYCEANGMKISTKVEAMMRDSMNNLSLSKFMKK